MQLFSKRHAAALLAWLAAALLATHPASAGSMPGAADLPHADLMPLNVMAYLGDSLSDSAASGSLCQQRGAALLVVAGGPAPQRRRPAEPAVTLSGPPELQASLQPVAAALGAAAAALESWLGRPAFPLHVEVGSVARLAGLAPPPLQQHAALPAGAPAAGQQQPAARQLRWAPARQRPWLWWGRRRAEPPDADGAAHCPGGALPWALYEVSSGRLLLDARLFPRPLAAGPAAAGRTAQQASAALALMQRLLLELSEHLVQGAGPSLHRLLASLPTALAAALAGAAAASVPMWFCIVCPIVLGLLAPLLVNYGLGAIAQQACDRFSLDPTECFDLWVGVLAVGFVLSLLASIPIFKVCRMYECAHPGPDPPPPAGS